MSASARSACLKHRGNVDERHRAGAAGAQEEVEVLTRDGEGLVIAADVVKASAGEHRGRREHEVAHHHPVIDVAPVQRARDPVPAARHLGEREAVGEQLLEAGAEVEDAAQRGARDHLARGVQRGHLGPDHPGLGHARETGELERELAGLPDVVGVQERHKLAAGAGQAGVARARHAGRAPGTGRRRARRRRSAPAITSRVSSVEPSSTTITSQLGPLLGEHAVDGARDHGRAIVSGDDHADHGLRTVVRRGVA